MPPVQNWNVKAREDAADMVDHFDDDIVEQIADFGEASDDINDRRYPQGDEYHHQSHVDRSYGLREAADLLDDLSDHEETDSGLWEGLEPRDAISAIAAFTYGNAVLHYWGALIDEINDAARALPEDPSKDQIRRMVKRVLAGISTRPPAGPEEWTP